ncbi:hypothetical protein Dsin_006805 [Dipteronia sinensis]|uniref:Uncharacterized protein n=1 Tax=Dipteronia sinensis TaxID=43782 RepID=A0AAE0EFX4_9ROSI|nr:hypothetical protein Dsin_006805 [Dipteronia sinensis]
MVVWSYPPTPKQLAMTIGFFISGASLFAAGAYLSLVNIAPQQARAKAHADIVLRGSRLCLLLPYRHILYHRAPNL